MLVVELQGIGGRIRSTLGLLVTNIIATIHAREAAQHQVQASFMAPFSPSVDYILGSGGGRSSCSPLMAKVNIQTELSGHFLI